MLNNLMNEQQNKKAVTSLILGIVSMAPIIILITSFFLPGNIALIFINVFSVLGYYIFGFILAVIGLVFGIMGLKSQKRKFAVAGITSSIIGLISLGVTLYIYLILLRIGTA